MTRWVPPAEVILPLLPDESVAVGLARLTMLNALVASARNWKTIPCSKLMLRKIPKSLSRNPGPIRVARDTCPSSPPDPMPPGLPGPLGVNAAVLNHADSTLFVEQTRQR